MTTKGLAPHLPALRDMAFMLAFGLVGGAAFAFVHVPLPWTLGPLTMAAILAIIGTPWRMPAPVRDLVRPVVGVLAGSAFTPETIGRIAAHWPSFTLVTLYVVATTLLGWWFFRRWCRQDPVTAFFAASPGGLGELTLLGGTLGGDMRALVLVHAIRIVVVVFTVPLVLQLALGAPIVRGGPATAVAIPEVWGWPILIACGVGGYLVGRLLRLPGGVMVGAMLLSALVHALGLTHLAPPGWLVVLVQIVIGTITGSRFLGVRWRELARVVAQAIIWAVLLVALSIGTAFLAARWLAVPFPVLLLAMAPGGMSEMAVIAYALGIEASFVMICQVGRIVLVTTAMPLAASLLKLGETHGGGDAGPQPRGGSS